VQNYFQLADRDRYLKVLESRLMPALVAALAEAGYEVADRGSAAGLVTATGARS
jgi:hypothetical protein